MKLSTCASKVCVKLGTVTTITNTVVSFEGSTYT